MSSYMLAGFVYPIVSRFFWNESGLFYVRLPVQDYAGSGVVFLVGGTAALITSFVTNLHVEHWQTPNNKGYSLPVSPKHDTPLSALRNILKEEGEQPEVVVHIGINDIAWSILMHGEYICLYVYMSGGLSGMLFTGLYIEQGQMVTLEYNCLALSAVMIWTTFTMGFLYLFLKLVGVLKPKMTRV
ncbi:uncharacterized protein LOC144599945 isoform X1 [Rhinoraja longicauda]